MNAYIVLMLILAVVGLVLGYFAMTNALALAGIMFAGSGAIVVLCVVTAWNIKIASSMYPIKVRCYGERYDSFTVTTNTRGRVVKDKKGYEWIELINGRRLKMPDRKYMMKGNDVYVDLFDTKEQQFPITINRDNIKDVYKKIIPEEQRVFFADKVIPTITEATRPPTNPWIQLIPVISVVTLCAILIVGMLFVPEYWMKSEEYGRKFMNALHLKEEALMDFVSTSPIVCNCPGYGAGDIEKPEPPPG